MVVRDKTREIGILLAMGMQRGRIRRVFLIQGIFIGLVGTTLGTVLGLILGGMRESRSSDSDRSVDLLHRSPAGAARNRWMRSLVIGASLVIATLAPLYPSAAGRAARARDARSATNERRSSRRAGSARCSPAATASRSRCCAASISKCGAAKFVAIVGASGAGKSTLLHLLGALDRPTGGDIWLDGSRYADLDARALGRAPEPKAGIRVPVSSSAAGVLGARKRDDAAADRRHVAAQARSRAEEVLAHVGLAGRMTHRPRGAVGRRAAALRAWRALWCMIRASSWRTSRPATSTTPTPSGCTKYSSGWRGSTKRRSWWSTHNRQLAGAGGPDLLAGGRPAHRRWSSVDAIP